MSNNRLEINRDARIGWVEEFERLTNKGKNKDEIIFENIEDEFDKTEWIWYDNKVNE